MINERLAGTAKFLIARDLRTKGPDTTDWCSEAITQFY